MAEIVSRLAPFAAYHASLFDARVADVCTSGTVDPVAGQYTRALRSVAFFDQTQFQRRAGPTNTPMVGSN
jgi:hypothetical protein